MTQIQEALGKPEQELSGKCFAANPKNFERYVSCIKDQNSKLTELFQQYQITPLYFVELSKQCLVTKDEETCLKEIKPQFGTLLNNILSKIKNL